MDMCAKGKNYNDRSSGPVNMVNDISNLNSYITTINSWYNYLAVWVWREESRKKNAFIVKKPTKNSLCLNAMTFIILS